MKNYLTTLEYLQKTLENQSGTAHSFIADTFIHMGKVYTAMNNKEKASEMFDKAIQSQLKELPSGHPDIAYTYTAQGLIHSDYGEEKEAFELNF